MHLLKKLTIILYFLSVSICVYSQNPTKVNGGNLNDLRNLYESFEENNEQAVPLVHNYISRAKSDGKHQHIFQGYKDLIYYSKNSNTKLLYADSCVYYAMKSGDPELISRSYLSRGIVYYFFFKKFQPALDEYLKAYNYSLNTKDEYLKNSIVYHLGVVKSYLGYYDEAQSLFDKCIAYFEPLSRGNSHPNIIFNNQKGYFNSLHQLAVCYRNMNEFGKSDSIVTHALTLLPASKEFQLEKAYFLKCKGVSEFRKGNYDWAVKNLSEALPELKKIDDFSWASVCFFYLGKSFLKANDTQKAITYFNKVDSIFQKHNFILPEVRENYEILIDYYDKIGDSDNELLFTKQLLKADNILGKDFKYLAPKIHREYDTKSLLKKQSDLESQNSHALILIVGAVLVITILLIILFKRNKKQKEVQKKYLELEQRLVKDEQNLEPDSKNIANRTRRKEGKLATPESVIEDLLQKLEIFEQGKEFTKKGLTQLDLSKKFNTNTTYLSQVINEYKGSNFNTYLNTLRINYITHELYHNRKFLDYTIEGLASDCGMPSRQSFTEIFTEINGIRPTVFIKKRKEELEEHTQKEK
ncbi:tetratricopeptide repeat protein [Chryseobacterium sp. R2ACT005]|uniref:tetratricopeptide repeat protein n=1 Tax=Chryseobacterium sp. R2ACT005 TaxID=3416668 RepID=UPI003CFABA69